MNLATAYVHYVITNFTLNLQRFVLAHLYFQAFNYAPKAYVLMLFNYLKDFIVIIS